MNGQWDRAMRWCDGIASTICHRIGALKEREMGGPLRRSDAMGLGLVTTPDHMWKGAGAKADKGLKALDKKMSFLRKK